MHSTATSDQQLHETFECCGEIDYVRTIQKGAGCSGTAFVCFKSADSVQVALELNKGELNGRPMNVTRCLTKDKIEVNNKKLQNKAGATKRIADKTDGKPEFTGAKAANGKKNKNKNKSKPAIGGPKLLAKKIAPKVQKVTA